MKGNGFCVWDIPDNEAAGEVIWLNTAVFTALRLQKNKIYEKFYEEWPLAYLARGHSFTRA